MNISKSNLFKLKCALLKLKSVCVDDGTVLIYDDDNLEVGADVFVDTEDGLVPAPDKDYTHQGKTIVVEGGKVTSISENPIEQPAEEVVVEEEVAAEVEEEKPVEEEVVVEEEPAPVEEEVVVEEEPETEDERDQKIGELEAVIEEQKAKIEELQKALDEANAKLEEPMAEPAEEDFKFNKVEKNNNEIDFSKYVKSKRK